MIDKNKAKEQVREFINKIGEDVAIEILERGDDFRIKHIGAEKEELLRAFENFLKEIEGYEIKGLTYDNRKIIFWIRFTNKFIYESKEVLEMIVLKDRIIKLKTDCKNTCIQNGILCRYYGGILSNDSGKIKIKCFKVENGAD